MNNFIKQLLLSLLAISVAQHITPMNNALPKIPLTRTEQRQLNAAFRHAIRSNKLKVAEQLLIAGADVNAKDRNDYTALFWAARDGWPKTCELLIKYGADTNCGVYQEPVWRVAARQIEDFDIPTTKLLLDDHILKHSKKSYSKSVIAFLCCLKNKKETANDILATTLYNQAKTLIMPYCRFNLHRCTAGINHQTISSGLTALMNAILNENVEACEFLIEQGADVNIRGTSLYPNCTALSLTRGLQHSYQQRLGIDRSAPDRLARQKNICELLIANGAIEEEED